MQRIAGALTAWGRVRASRVYRSAAIGPAQADYLNAAVAIASTPAPTPRELLESLQELERLEGRDRDRETRWGPRPIDLDVLLWGERVIDVDGPPRLRVPHERLAERRFALLPVIDLVGESLLLPGNGRRLGALVDSTANQRVELTAFAIE